MTAPGFSIADRSTWPEVLTADEVGPIYRRTPLAIKRACSARTFVPSPFAKHPFRWRKADIVRHLDASTAPMRFTRSA